MTTPTSRYQDHQHHQAAAAVPSRNRPQHAYAGTTNSSYTSTSPPSAGGVKKMVAGYTLESRLGSGSFATVYKGVKVLDSHGTTEIVAIKAITRASEKLTKKVLENLEMEISILRTYRHPNIVCLRDVQKTERHFYLLLEYCSGGDVQGLIRSRRTGRLTERLTRRLVRDLTAGLKFLWSHELIHRDIKPQNLLLTGPLPLDELHDLAKTDAEEQERRLANYPSDKFGLKIADFGFARHLQTTSLAETLCGSPLYMAPEILQHHRYDAKADLWSAGTVLFEMISGRPPFHGENHIDLLRNIQRKAVRLPSDVRVSKECVNLLRLLLNRNPLTRAGFKEFFEASDAFVALGCGGTGGAMTTEADAAAAADGGGDCIRRLQQPGLANLGPILETDESQVQARAQVRAPGAGSMATVATTATAVNDAQQQRFQPARQMSSGRDSERNTPNSSPPASYANIDVDPSRRQSQSQQQQSQQQQQQQQQPMGGRDLLRADTAANATNLVTPPFGPVHAPTSPIPPATTAMPPGAAAAAASRNSQGMQQQQQVANNPTTTTRRRSSHFAPLEPSPPGPTGLCYAAPTPPPLSLDGGAATAAAAPAPNYVAVAATGGHMQNRTAAFPQPQQSPSGHPGAVVPFQQAEQHHSQAQNQSQYQQRRPDSLQSSGSDEHSFVMVEHGASHSPVATNSNRYQGDQQQQQRQTTSQVWKQSAPGSRFVHQLQHPTSPPPSPGRSYYTNAAALPPRGGSGQPVGSLASRILPSSRGILSTSPGTGRALVGMMGTAAGCGNRSSSSSSSSIVSAHGGNNTGGQFQNINRFETIGSPQLPGAPNVELATKMLAAAEDVGRRAVAVAHLGDTRAYLAMRLIMLNEGGASFQSCSPMEGVEEENCDGITDSEDTASSSTLLAAPGRRRTVSTDRSTGNPDVPKEGDDDDDDEMPFAVAPATGTETNSSLTPILARPSVSTVSNSSTLTNSKTSGRASPAMIQAHFREALSCYLKALSMIKGAVGATQRVLTELGGRVPPSTKPTEAQRILALKKRCDASHAWLGGQFAGVLERADAANVKVAKLKASMTENPNEQTDAIPIVAVEELVYNHSLANGRDGAVKQLLGQNEVSRSCYRSAGLLAETLLMEPKLGDEDRNCLETLVQGFAERITELDSIMMQQSRVGAASHVGSMSGQVGQRRGSAVVGLVGGGPTMY